MGTPPTAEELGRADSVYVDELGDTEVVVFKVGNKESRVSTIVIRGATDNYMDDIERAVDDGVNVFKGVCKDGRLTAGGGSTEIELARQVSAWGETHAGLEQYSINKFAEALEVVPRVLAENSGVKPREVIAKLYAAHSEGKTNMGFDIEGNLEKSRTVWSLRYSTCLLPRSGPSSTQSTPPVRFSGLTRSSWQSVPEVQSLETRAEEWTRTTIKSPTNPQARNFYTPLCICENIEYVFADRVKYVFECHCFDEAWLIHDLDLEVSLQYPVLISITHSQTVKMPCKEDAVMLK